MEFNFSQDYVLENEVVQLRPLAESDFDLLLNFSIGEPEIWKYNAGGANGADNLKIYIENAISQRSGEKEYPFIVFDKRANQYAGSTRFYEFQLNRKTVEIGYTWYGRDYQRTGLNKNCKFLLLSFAFDQLGMERVGFRANSRNERSINAMKSIGCTEEGVLRSFNYDAIGDRLDAIILSILKQEWQAGLKDRLLKKIESGF